MINKEDFANRLKKVLDTYEISAASLADRIGIQRSSISHLLSGRNNPSLDFVIKILDNYPAISFDWFVKGIGEMNTESQEEVNHKKSPTLFDTTNQTNELKKEKSTTPSRMSYSEKKIEKILLLYSDGSFESYKP